MAKTFPTTWQVITSAKIKRVIEYGGNGKVKNKRWIEYGGNDKVKNKRWIYHKIIKWSQNHEMLSNNNHIFSNEDIFRNKLRNEDIFRNNNNIFTNDVTSLPQYFSQQRHFPQQ